MMAALPTVTVLMPLLNGEPHLAEALAALRSQSRPPLEILVLDGGSTDGSRERVRDETGATLVDPPGGRLYPSLNAGMARAVGDVVVFTSSDDVMEPRALESHVAALDGAPAAGYSVGKVRLFADEGGVSQRVPGTLAGTVRAARLLETIAVRRPFLDVVGGFRDEIGTSADVEWLARLGDLGIPSVLVDAVVVSKRLHTGNTSYTDEAGAVGITRSLRLSILRKQGRA
jgi:glycosyltransferase involved in cell wall biosynthesis